MDLGPEAEAYDRLTLKGHLKRHAPMQKKDSKFKDL